MPLNTGLSFNTSPPTVLSNPNLTIGISSSISDANGNLLFYTDGITIWDKTHNVMSNGTGLNQYSSSIPSTIIKNPSSNTKYSVITNNLLGLYVTTVDMALSSGNGSVTSKNQAVYSGSVGSMYTATRHCNGIDYWIIGHKLFSNDYFALRLTPTGVTNTIVSSTNYTMLPLY